MNIAFRKSFTRDLKKLSDSRVRDRIRKSIDVVESAEDIRDIPDCKKLAGSEDCYRIRLGDYRIGATIVGDTLEFVRCLHRRDLYRYFP